MTREIKVRLAGLKSGGRVTPGHWLLDQSSHAICVVSDTGVISPLIIPHPDSLGEDGVPSGQWLEQAAYIVEALNSFPMLVDAIERMLLVADGLEDTAVKRDHAAHWARQEGRYDLSEVHRQSARRARTARQAVLEELYGAFKITRPKRKRDNHQKTDESAQGDPDGPAAPKRRRRNDD